MTEGKLFTRRHFLKKGSVILAGLFGLMTSTSLYSIIGERFWIQTKEIRLSMPTLPKAFSGLRIVQFSDVHLGHYYNLENLSSLVSKINSLQPEMICLTGDFVHDYTDDLERSVEVLSKLEAPYGKYAILGNHDYWLDVRLVTDVLERSGFQVLVNEHKVVELKGEQVYIAGIDDALSGRPNIELALSKIPSTSFTILLAHEPDYAEISKKFPVDLQLSGHSHGGQIRLPFYGAIYTPDYARIYFDGLEQVDKMLLYTNRGIGTTGIPVRFFCRPEISVFTIEP
jgi:predicted MPP superfamily phosphohydrolase